MTQKYQVKVSMKQAAIVETGIVLKQGDFGMQLEIEVLDFDATGTTPQIVFRKAMGAVESTTISVSGNKYTYTFVGTELDTPGKCFCDLKLKNSTTQRISTASFMFKVVADTLDGLAEESSSYSDTIAQIVGGFNDDITNLQTQIDNNAGGEITYTSGNTQGYYNGSSVVPSSAFTCQHFLNNKYFSRLQFEILTQAASQVYVIKDGVQTSYIFAREYDLDIYDAEEIWINFFGSTYCAGFKFILARGIDADEWAETSAQVHTNKTNIQTNTSNIATNTYNISKNHEQVYQIQKQNFIISEESPVNLIKRPYLIPNEYINPDGDVRQSDAFCRTDYIEVEAGQNYIGANVGLSAFYDTNKTFISTVANFTNATPAPTGAKYLICDIPTSSKNVCILIKGSSIPSTVDNGILSFENLFKARFNNLVGAFVWEAYNIKTDTQNYTITFPARTVFQSYITGKYLLINASATKTYTLTDGQCIVLNTDFNGNKTVNDFDEGLTVMNLNTLKTGIVVLARVQSQLSSQIDNLPIGSNDIARDIFLWSAPTINKSDKTITFPARTVFQSYSTGKYLLINASAAKTYTIAEAKKLIIENDFSSNVTITDFDEALSLVNNSYATKYNVIIANISNSLYSDMLQIYEAIKGETQANEMPEPPITTKRLSDCAPIAFALMKNKTTDMNIVMVGDSISTALGYEASFRSDAKFRPPLMNEYTYPSYIEEQIRWNGQVYNRFDVDGVFTEVCDSAEDLTQDTEHWDWESNNNRPALTRCLSGTDCSVSYLFDPDYKREDFIFRTDCTNPSTATVTISAGDGKVLVYDDDESDWVEANNFSYSAQESSTPIISSFNSQPLMKSMYQKRLKMKWAGNPVSNCTVTIQNNGEGRLTYWGIQKGKKEVMLNFINSARGGHSTMRLKPFEEWDVDYWKPQLILWEPPYFNHSAVDICDQNYTPLTNRKTVSTMVSDFTTYLTALKNKSYNPEIITWSIWLASSTVHSIDQNGEWLHGIDTAGNYVSTRDYVNGIEMMIRGLSVPFIDFMSMFRTYGYEYAKWRDIDEYETATTIASGITGKTWTVDGGHLNDTGALLLKKMFGTFFIQ